MTMPLPDIDEASWDEYQRQKLQEDLQAKMDSFSLQAAIGEKMADVQALAAPPPEPPPPPPQPDLSRIGSWAGPSPGQMQAATIASGQARPEAPEPTPAAPQDSAPAPSRQFAPDWAPPIRQPAPTSAPSSGRDDWVTSMLANVASSGGDVHAFADHLNELGGAATTNVLSAASRAGSDIQRFSSNLSAPPPEATAAGPSPGGAASGTPASGGVPDWLSDMIARNAPPELAADPDFIRTVAAGAKAESGWDVNRVQNGFSLGDGGGARGLFQFDMGGMGSRYRGNEQALLGQEGAELQASQIVPLYAKAYASAPAGLSGAEKASWVAAQAERPAGFTDPNSAARRNYAAAYGEIGGQGAQAGASTQELLSRTGSWTPPAKQISQFGDTQLSNDEAYAACGPAAAVRFAQMYGRNPSLREATDLAATVGWTSSGGMAGIGSEQKLMEKMGIQTNLTNDLSAMAREASTGNPVTISTPGHYFFADGYDANTGAFHVGQSGLDLRGGSEWMTPAQMEARMGKIQGALLADNPQVPATSTADMDTNPLGYLGRAKDAITNTISSGMQSAKDWLSPESQRELFPASQAGLANSDRYMGTMVPGDVPELDAAVSSVARREPGSPGGPPDYTDFGRANAQATAGQPSGLDQTVGNALEDFGRNGPIGWTRDRLQDAARAVTGGATIDIAEDPTKQLSEARQQLGRDVTANVENVVPQGIPVVSGVGNIAGLAVGGFLEQPSALDAADTIAELTNKYPLRAENGKLASVLPNLDVMTPEDRQRYSDAMMNIGGITAGGSGKALRPAARAIEREVVGPLTTEAQQLLRRTDLGGVPTVITSNLRRIAEENGVQVTPETTPNDLIGALRTKAETPAPTAAATAFEGARAAPGETVTAETPNAPVSATFGGPTPTREAPAGYEGLVDAMRGAEQRAREVREAQRPSVEPTELPQGAEPITLSPEMEAARLRLGDYPEDLQHLIRDHAEGIDWARLQRRGVIPDEAVKDMADRYAKDITVDQVIQNGRAGKAYSAEQIRALRNATGAQAAIVRDAAARLGEDASDMALQRFGVEADRLTNLTRITEGARAESGRGLRAWQGGVDLQELAPNEAVQQISRKLGGDKAKLLEAIGEYNKLVDTGAGPIQMANFWAGIRQPPVGVTDWFKLVRYNSMLSGPRTFMVNAISNALEVPWRLGRDTAATGIRVAKGDVGVREGLGEVGTEISGAWAGLAQANRAFLDTWANGISERQARLGELPLDVSARIQNPVGKKIAQVLEVPTRGLSAADEWMRAINYNMALGREAAVQASKEGLRGDAWSARTAQIMSTPEIAPQLMKNADAAAERMTYKGEMGTLGEVLAGTRRLGAAGNILLPFLRTTYQLTARGIDRSPLGLLGTGYDVLKGKYGRDLGAALSGEGPRPKGAAPLGERLGDNLMGSTIFTGLFVKAMQGDISAAGPDNAQDRALLQSEGWQPYSLKIGDRWVSYANMGPAAIPFALAAAAAESGRYAKPGAETQDYILDGFRRTAQLATEQTYLQSIGSIWRGFSNPEQYGSQAINDVVTSAIPYGSAINTLAQAMDPITRRSDRFNILDAIQNRLPPGTPVIGGRESVPPAQDVLGRSIPNQQAGLGALVPVRTSQERPDALLQEMDRVGYAPPAPPKEMTRAGYTYELTPDEQREVYGAAGELIEQRAGNEMKTEGYAKLNDSAKAKRLQQIVTAARTEAENKWLNSLSREDIAERRAKSQQRKEVVPVSGR